MTAYTAATTVAPAAGDNYSAQQGCFEGPEKLLELWFSPSPHKLRRVSCVRGCNSLLPSPIGTDSDISEPSTPDGSYVDQDVLSYAAFKANQLRKYDGAGLRVVPKPVWDEMLAIVRCTVLSTIRNDHVDAYLLSESSMFIYPHKMVLKTCGTTTLLNALPHILKIARDYCGFEKVWRVFYSRKSFMFPDKQQGPHKSWEQEVSFLNNHFDNGSDYKIGQMNGDNWHLYLTSPADDVLHHKNGDSVSDDESAPQNYESFPDCLPTPTGSDSEVDHSPFGNSGYPQQDQTIEILMTRLNPRAMSKFYHHADEEAGTPGGRRVDQQTGIGAIYPTAQLDSYLFQPCGYSANGLWDGSYWTIHVTPEPSCSYASFETNIPVEVSHPVTTLGEDNMSAKTAVKQVTPIQALIHQVTTVFQPDSFSVTFFSSHPRVPDSTRGRSDSGVGNLDLLHHAKDDGRYHHDHTSMINSMANIEGYRRADRILYEFKGYDLVFGHYIRV